MSPIYNSSYHQRPVVLGQNPTGQKPIGQYPSGQNPRKTKTQEDKIPGGQKPRGTKAQGDKIQVRQKPRVTKAQGDKTPQGQKPMEDNIPGYRIPGGQNPKIFPRMMHLCIKARKIHDYRTMPSHASHDHTRSQALCPVKPLHTKFKLGYQYYKWLLMPLLSHLQSCL